MKNVREYHTWAYIELLASLGRVFGTRTGNNNLEKIRIEKNLKPNPRIRGKRYLQDHGIKVTLKKRVVILYVGVFFREKWTRILDLSIYRASCLTGEGFWHQKRKQQPRKNKNWKKFKVISTHTWETIFARSWYKSHFKKACTYFVCSSVFSWKMYEDIILEHISSFLSHWGGFVEPAEETTTSKK